LCCEEEDLMEERETQCSDQEGPLPMSRALILEKANIETNLSLSCYCIGIGIAIVTGIEIELPILMAMPTAIQIPMPIPILIPRADPL